MRTRAWRTRAGAFRRPRHQGQPGAPLGGEQGFRPKTARCQSQLAHVHAGNTVPCSHTPQRWRRVVLHDTARRSASRYQNWHATAGAHCHPSCMVAAAVWTSMNGVGPGRRAQDAAAAASSSRANVPKPIATGKHCSALHPADSSRCAGIVQLPANASSALFPPLPTPPRRCRASPHCPLHRVPESDTEHAMAPTKLALALDWLPNAASHAGFYVAKAQGLYEKHGLDVQIISPHSGGWLCPFPPPPRWRRCSPLLLPACTWFGAGRAACCPMLPSPSTVLVQLHLADDYKATPASRVESGEALFAIAPSGAACARPCKPRPIGPSAGCWCRTQVLQGLSQPALPVNPLLCAAPICPQRA